MKAFVSSPQTLQEWRSQKNQPKGEFPRHMWTPLEAFFISQGYTLWQPYRTMALYLRAPNDEPRRRDQYTHRILYNDIDIEPIRAPHFDMLNSIHCPARTIDNQDALIRLITIGQDRGERHRMALSRLATGNDASHRDNHVLPVLHEIVYGDMTFAVFPLVSMGFSHPWYYCFSEVLDAVDQILEGINFCHERLVAHLDIDSDNILINWVGGRCQPPEASETGRLAPFRSLFPSPIRYYINDFELAVTFDPKSAPSERVVIGFPTSGIRTGEYARDIAPEMLSGNPYCPFRADIWQLGTMFTSYFGHLGNLSQPLIELFGAMSAEPPGSRPVASVALECMRQIRLDLPGQVLLAGVPYSPLLMKRLAADNAKHDAEIEARTRAHTGPFTFAPTK